MSFFRKFPRRSYAEVSEILVSTGHESILEEITSSDSGYTTVSPVSKLGPLPTYKFAIACALASLGSHEISESICGNPQNFIEPGWGDNISRELASLFMTTEQEI